MDTLIIKNHVFGNDTVPVITEAKGTIPKHIIRGITGTGSSFSAPFRFSFHQKITIISSEKEPSAIERKFRRLADQWRKETGHLSSTTKKVVHPAYQQIIGMGHEVLPLILRELKRNKGHWLWALFSITGEDPAPEGSTFTEAVDAWLSWGVSHGYGASD